MIDRFDGPYFFLSNFYPCKIHWQGRTWPSSEHAFQASKTEDPSWRDQIFLASTAGRSKRLGRAIPPHLLLPNWNQIKLDVMYRILKAKFLPGSELAILLELTGSHQLVEGNWWQDTFWGVYDGVGQNWLGKLLMQVRTENRLLASGELPSAISV